jgi:succinyl-diaminopimelate desuccinylase
LSHNPKFDDPLFLAVDLIRCPSITPDDHGALDVLQAALEQFGFTCRRFPFSSAGGDPVDNLYARLGTASPNFCYAGHTDVVPVGDEKVWKYPPFAAEVVDGILYGRGASDMKGAIAAYVAALSNFLEKHKGFAGSLSLLITGDEEGPAKNGTKRMLKELKKEGEVIDMCLVGEPTNVTRLGEMIKVGRRGSLNTTLTVHGKQGHAAYPERAYNPVPDLTLVLDALREWKLDAGNEFFQPSNLEVTNLSAGTGAFNVIPGQALAKFNIRFNNLHTSESLITEVKKVVQETGIKHTLEFDVIGEAFFNEPRKLAGIVKKAIKTKTGLKAEFGTTGGSSDARFIKDYCPVVEFGLTGETIHAVNECVTLKNLEDLAAIYEEVLKGVFLGP